MFVIGFVFFSDFSITRLPLHYIYKNRPFLRDLRINLKFCVSHNKEHGSLCILHSLGRSAQKKKTSVSATNVLLSFIMVIFLYQSTELSHAANPTITIQEPINENIFFSPLVFDCYFLFEPLYSEYLG